MRQRTAHLTRSSHSTSGIPNDNHRDMKSNFNNYGQKIVNSSLEAIKERFGQDSRILMNNIPIFTKLNDYSDDQIFKKFIIKCIVQLNVL